jgi:hypothetical protein
MKELPDFAYVSLRAFLVHNLVAINIFHHCTVDIGIILTVFPYY